MNFISQSYGSKEHNVAEQKVAKFPECSTATAPVVCSGAYIPFRRDWQPNSAALFHIPPTDSISDKPKFHLARHVVYRHDTTRHVRRVEHINSEFSLR